MKKRCWRCDKSYPANTTFFYKNIGKKNGLSDECKVCKRLYQYNRNKELRLRRKNFVISKGNKCNSCGIHNKNTSFFDVDHIVPVRKTKEPRSLPSSWSDKKFQVLCPNCHRLKTIKENESKT